MGTDCTACCEASTDNSERSRQHRRRIALAHKKLQHPYDDEPIETGPKIVFHENNLADALQNTRISGDGESDFDPATYKV